MFSEGGANFFRKTHPFTTAKSGQSSSAIGMTLAMRGFLISGKHLKFYGHLNTALSVNIEDDPLIPTDPQPKSVHHH
jgi:hypothetical protein